MRIIAHIAILLWFLYGIPQEEWYGMNDAQQDAVLDRIADKAIEELACEEVELRAYIKGTKWVYIYGNCTEEEYIALNERGIQ